MVTPKSDRLAVFPAAYKQRLRVHHPYQSRRRGSFAAERYRAHAAFRRVVINGEPSVRQIDLQLLQSGDRLTNSPSQRGFGGYPVLLGW